MLVKCYWKMYQTPDEQLDSNDIKHKIPSSVVLNTLKTAVRVANNAPKSRNSDPILEPHYKIVSILHKLVMRGDMRAVDAATLLSEQPFGVPLNPDDIFASFSEPEDWEEYVIPNLIKLREKDKSNWQHRIVARHANILFEDGNSGSENRDLKVEAQAAFGILRENMFTKTMVMNVWKCDAERPGRHHVYTEQYVRFMTKLLVIISDKTNLELLLRRLRKKGADYYHFTDLWQSCCIAYLKLLRETYQIPVVTEETFKSLSAEEFEIISERITEWAAGSDTEEVVAFNCMKESIELKKLNANLMKVAAIDDLINDCYSKIYVDIASKLPGLDPGVVIQERNQAKEVAAQLEAAANAEAASNAEAKAASSLINLLNPSAMQDVLPGTSTPLEGEKAEAAPKPRKTGVRRPDVLRKAEQAVVRSMEIPKSTATRSRVGSMSSGKRGSQTPHAASDADSEGEGPDAQVRREAGEDIDTDMRDAHAVEDLEDEAHDDSKVDEKDEPESEAGSLHDSADDESDLSDVPDDYDEDIPPGFLMLNIRRPERSAEINDENAECEVEGDEPDEMDHEEEGVEEEHEDEVEVEEHEHEIEEEHEDEIEVRPESEVEEEEEMEDSREIEVAAEEDHDEADDEDVEDEVEEEEEEEEGEEEGDRKSVV